MPCLQLDHSTHLQSSQAPENEGLEYDTELGHGPAFSSGAKPPTLNYPLHSAEVRAKRDSCTAHKVHLTTPAFSIFPFFHFSIFPFFHFPFSSQPTGVSVCVPFENNITSIHPFIHPSKAFFFSNGTRATAGRTRGNSSSSKYLTYTLGSYPPSIRGNFQKM